MDTFSLYLFFLGGFYQSHQHVPLLYIFSLKSVQQQDAGKYWCEVEHHGIVISSEPAWITVEGKINISGLFSLQLHMLTRLLLLNDTEIL